MGILLPALAAGFSIAASPGAVNLLCIRWGLQSGARTALLIGLGAATVDTLYMALAIVGVLPALDAIDWLEGVLLVVGGLVLIALGLASLRTGLSLTEESLQAPATGGAVGRRPYLVGLGVTISNPSTIAGWLAISGGLLASAEISGTSASDIGEALLALTGVFAGSAAWFAILAGVIAAVHGRVGVGFVRGASVVAAVLLIGLGALLLVRAATEAI